MVTMNDWIKRNGSRILTCFGAGGMIAAVVLAVKATPKAMRACTDAQVEKGRNRLTKLEIIGAAAPAYISTATVGIGALACIFGANALSKRQQAALASAYTALASAFEGYRERVERLCGPGTNAMLDKTDAQERGDADDDRPPWDEPQTFYLDCDGKAQFFERTMEDVLRAEYCINRNLVLRGNVTLNELLAFLRLEPVAEGDRIGWDEYIGETLYGYRWIDFEHRYFVTEEGLTVCSIDTPFSPHPLDEGVEE